MEPRYRGHFQFGQRAVERAVAESHRASEDVASRRPTWNAFGERAACRLVELEDDLAGDQIGSVGSENRSRYIVMKPRQTLLLAGFRDCFSLLAGFCGCFSLLAGFWWFCRVDPFKATLVDTSVSTVDARALLRHSRSANSLGISGYSTRTGVHGHGGGYGFQTPVFANLESIPKPAKGQSEPAGFLRTSGFW
jgi:hypothetical protein